MGQVEEGKGGKMGTTLSIISKIKFKKEKKWLCAATDLEDAGCLVQTTSVSDTVPLPQ